MNLKEELQKINHNDLDLPSYRSRPVRVLYNFAERAVKRIEELELQIEEANLRAQDLST